MSTVEITNIGGIPHFTMEIPDDVPGGVLVVKGDNGEGKSTAIEVIRVLLGKKPSLSVNDAADKGRAEGFGKTLKVAGRTTQSGELEVPSLEGKFDFSDLVLPDGQTEEVRDRVRVKALLSLTGAKADARLFYDLVGGQKEFERIVPADQLKTDDLIEMAGRVKRAIDAKAREKESEAQHAENHATSCQLAAGEVKAGDAPDIDALHRKSTEAAAELSRLQERSKAAVASEQAVKASEERLAAIVTAYSGPKAADAKQALEIAEGVRTRAETELEKLRQQVASQEKAVADAKLKQMEARGVFNEAVAHENAVGELKEQIEIGGQVEAPSAMDLRLASEDADDARQALERAIVTRDLAKKAAEAAEHKQKSKEASKAAQALRDAAGGVDQVLSTQLPPGPLKALKGRLVCNDPKRGEDVPFDDASDGIKYRMALPYGIQSVGRGGFLALQQAGWQDLGTGFRQEIAGLLRESHVWLITGELTNGELRAEVFQA